MTYLSDLVDPAEQRRLARFLQGAGRMGYKRALADEHLRVDIAATRDAREPELRERLRKYGLSVPAYRAMLVGQGGKCAGCGAPMAPGEDVVDHCHITDGVRGLVHGKCNSVLGFANDNPIRLRALADYLDRSR